MIKHNHHIWQNCHWTLFCKAIVFLSIADYHLDCTRKWYMSNENHPEKNVLKVWEYWLKQKEYCLEDSKLKPGVVKYIFTSFSKKIWKFQEACVEYMWDWVQNSVRFFWLKLKISTYLACKAESILLILGKNTLSNLEFLLFRLGQVLIMALFLCKIKFLFDMFQFHTRPFQPSVLFMISNEGYLLFSHFEISFCLITAMMKPSFI